MSQIELLHNALDECFPISEFGDGVRVITHCLYPGNSFVRVIVRGGKDTFFVSDEGNAFSELSAAGVSIENPDVLVRRLVSDKGLSIRNGVITSPMVGADALGVVVALVANVSMEVATWLFAHARIKKERDFKSVVQQFLKARFNESVKHDALVGASNKMHKFENLIRLPSGKRIIVDPVMHDANSINSRVVANLDVRSAGYSDLEQRIIYDDEEEWKPDELNLLQVGATVVPFSRASQVFERLVLNG